jgi:hypothetical protein
MSLAGMLLESYRSPRVFVLGGRGLSRRQSSGGGHLMALAGGVGVVVQLANVGIADELQSS